MVIFFIVSSYFFITTCMDACNSFHKTVHSKLLKLIFKRRKLQHFWSNKQKLNRNWIDYIFIHDWWHFFRIHRYRSHISKVCSEKNNKTNIWKLFRKTKNEWTTIPVVVILTSQDHSTIIITLIVSRGMSFLHLYHIILRQEW